jgi:outer membrane immunogenic protein
MKRSLLAGCGLLAMVAAASAADLPRGPYKAPAAYAPVYNWTGLYVGAHAGYGWSGSSDINMRGGFIGGQIGYNWQAMGSPWVLGIEFDSAWADMGRTGNATSGATVVSINPTTNYTGTLRARAGYAWDRTMLYATGGLAWMNNSISVNATSGAFTAGMSDSKMHVGGAIGAGLEYALAPNWSAKAEYLYTTYAKETYLGNIGAGGFGLSADSHTLKAGINYHFK